MTGFPKNSAFSPDESHIRRLFESSERVIKREEGRREASIPFERLEEWYHVLDEIANNQVPNNHHIAGSTLNHAADQAADLRDDLARYLRG